MADKSCAVRLGYKDVVGEGARGRLGGGGRRRVAGLKHGLSAGSSSKDASEEVVCMIIHY